MLSLAFPKIISAKLPKYIPNLNLINIQWLAVFINAAYVFLKLNIINNTIITNLNKLTNTTEKSINYS